MFNNKNILLAIFITAILGSGLSYAATTEAPQTNSKITQKDAQKSSISLGTRLADIKKRGILRVAMHAKDHHPFFMTDPEGKLIGIDVELAQDIAQQLGVKLEIDREATTFDNVVKRIVEGHADIAISKLSLTLKRAQIIRYTIPYTSLGKALLVNRVRLLKSGSGLSVKELFNKAETKIATLSGSSYETFAKRIFPNATIYGSQSWDREIIPKIIKGDVWGAFRDELEVRRTLFLTKDVSLHLLGIKLEDERDPIVMAINNNAPLLQEWLNIYVKNVYKSEPIQDSILRFK